MVELYDLNNNSWKCIDYPAAGPNKHHFVARNPSAYVDGFNYWLSFDEGKPYMLQFDFAKEELLARYLPIPIHIGETDLDFDFLDFKGRICVIFFPKFGADDKKNFEVWLIQGKGGKGGCWVKEFEFRVPGAEKPLGSWDDGRLLFFQGVDGGLMAYDVDRGKTRKLDVYDPCGKMKLLPYLKTNVSIKGLLGSSKLTTSNFITYL